MKNGNNFINFAFFTLVQLYGTRANLKVKREEKTTIYSMNYIDAFEKCMRKFLCHSEQLGKKCVRQHLWKWWLSIEDVKRNLAEHKTFRNCKMSWIEMFNWNPFHGHCTRCVELEIYYNGGIQYIDTYSWAMMVIFYGWQVLIPQVLWLLLHFLWIG